MPEKLLNRINKNERKYNFNLFPDKSWDTIADGIGYTK
jgi:hypothetical protein